jgi:hypothetical protein
MTVKIYYVIAMKRRENRRKKSMTNWAGLGALPFNAVPVNWSVPLSKNIK